MQRATVAGSPLGGSPRVQKSSFGDLDIVGRTLKVDPEPLDCTATSLASSATDYRYENGRRYHAYKDEQYYLSNDEVGFFLV